MIIGDMEIRLRADIARLQADMDRARSVVSGAMGDITKVVDLAKKAMILFAGVSSVKAFAGMVNGSIEAAGGMHDLSIQTGASVASLMAFKSVASTSETTIDGITGAMGKMAKGMSGAGEDSAGVGQAIKALGLDFDRLKAMAPDEQMLTVAKAMDQFRDGTGKAAVAMTLYGKEGAKMLPFLKDLADESDAVTAKLTEQEKASKAMQAAMADDFGDNLTKIKKASEEWKKDLSMGMLPALYEASDAFLTVTTGAGGLKDNISKLSKDGSVTNWSRMAVDGLTYVFDAAEGVKRVFSSIGTVIGASMAVLGTNIGAMIEAGNKALHGDFSGAIGVVNSAVGQTKQIFSDLGDTLDKTWSEETFGSQLRARMEEVRKVGVEAKEAKKNLDFDSTADTAAAAARKKEADSFATLTAAIRSKIEENRLELEVGRDLTEGQKLQIKIDQELESGKLKLTDGHKRLTQAMLDQLDVSEKAVSADKAQRSVTLAIAASTAAREKMVEVLDVEYAMYGKTTDARAIAMVAIEAEAWRKQQLADLEAKKEPITERMLTQLDAEKRARILVGEATLGQTKALQYASQLAEENKRFGLDYIADDRERASAQLAIDSQLWQERIALAGDGTEAQKLLQQEYVVWYRNQSIKPQLDEQKKMWASIEQTAHDTFISIFDSSKNAWARMRDSAKNIFFDWLYQMTMKKWIVNIGASVGFDGSTAMAQAMAGGPDATAGSIGAGNSTITAAQAASNVYTMFKSGGTMEQSIASGVQTGFDKLGLSMGSGAPGQAAQWAGQIGGTVGGYMIGSTLNSAISGKYETGSGFMTAEKIGTAVASAIFGPIGGAVAGAISGLVNRAFGMGPKEVTDQGLKGTLSASSLSGQSYTSYHQDGGWFRSDKNGTDTKALTDAMIKQFTQGLAAIENASSGFAMSLGVQADWIKDYSKEFDLKLTGEQAKDQQAITDFFTGIGDEIAGKLVPNLNDFAKSGEALSATLQRLAGDFQGTDKVAQLLGFSADTLFGAAGLGGAKAREQLIDMAGGLSALSSQAAFFNQNFLTDAERIKPVAEALDKALASLGLSTIPATRDEFKSLVNSLITSGAAASESGARQLDSLLALAEAFAQVHPAADAAAEAVDKAAAALQAVKDAAATMLAGVNDSYSVLQRVVSREKSVIQVSIDAHTAAFGKLQSLSQALHSTLDSLKSPDQKAMERAVGQAQIRAALAIAKAGGPLPDSEKLKQALSAVTQDASSQFGSYADYMRDLLQTQNDVAQLAGLTDDSLSVEQRSLDALKAQLARLDGIVANGQLQLDALNGQSIATLSLGQALAAFQSSISTAQTNPVVGGTATIAGFYQDLLGRAPDAAGFDYWKGILAGGTSLDKIRSFFMESDEYKGLHKIPGFALGGAHAGGLRIVGENGPELEATGPSRIWSSNQTAALLARASSGGGVDVSELVVEVRELRKENSQLRADLNAGLRAIATHTMETKDTLDKWDVIGQPATRTD